MNPADALKFFTDCRAMIEDPDMTGDLLAFGVALTYELRQRKQENRPASMRLQDRGRSAWRAAADVSVKAHGGAKWVIRTDAPAYEMVRHDDDYLCQGTMTRRDGVCGQRGSKNAIIYDAETGERRDVTACRNPKHIAEMEAQSKPSRDAWLRNGSPQPAANKGGVLMRYFDTDWDQVYDWATDGWFLTRARAHSNFRPSSWVQPTPPRPRLFIVGAVDE